MDTTDDVRIRRLRPLIPPAILMDEVPLSEEDAHFVWNARREIGEVVTGVDSRLLVVVGPCSVHSPEQALEYAELLKPVADRLKQDLLIVMRTYFEKPRTTVGWKGLINDPHLDGTFQINAGLRAARTLLRDVVRIGLAPGTEFLDPISPQFVADLVCWGAIGARTSESQVHRELASGLSMPLGFKNGTGGSVGIAVDAIRSALHSHHFLSVTKQGLAAIVETAGNEQTHLILRGGGGKSNFEPDAVAGAVSKLEAATVNPYVMVDCSHANSGKDPSRQPIVAKALADQIAAGQKIQGVMLESFILGGNQPLVEGQPLERGRSITDACLAWPDTVPVLEQLAEAVRARRVK